MSENKTFYSMFAIGILLLVFVAWVLWLSG